MNIRTPFISLIALLIFHHKSLCQNITYDSVLEQQLLTNIYKSQIHHEKEFLRGLIPSYREHLHNKGILKNDSNIFFTALVAFTLRSIYNDLNFTSRLICDSILAETANVFPYYQNRKGRPTYNFWRTDKPELFPNAGWLNLFNKSHAPADDMDDTVIVLMAIDSPDSTVRKVHQIMQGFLNNNKKEVERRLPAYKDIAAYSTWFGKKTIVELDFGGLANVLYMIHKYRLPYTKADSASLQFICRVVENRDYMNNAVALSPYYNRTSVLLYHLSRFMSIAKIPELEKFKPRLIEDATLIYHSSDNTMDKIMLSTTLLQWGVQLPDDTLFINEGFNSFIENSDFVFFMANITSMLPRPLNMLLSNTGIGTFYYYSPAYNYAILLENMVWRKRLASRVSN